MKKMAITEMMKNGYEKLLNDRLKYSQSGSRLLTVTLHWQQRQNSKNEQANDLFSSLMAGENGHDAQRAEYHLSAGDFQTGFSPFLALLLSIPSASRNPTNNNVS